MKLFKFNIQSSLAAGILLSGFLSGCLGLNDDKPDAGVVPAALNAKGEARFKAACTGCHGTDAKGIEDAVPPLYHSDFLMADKHRPIRIQFLGLPNAVDTATTIIVSGDTFAGISMPDIGYCSSDSEIAAVLSYVRATFNTATDYIHVEEVATLRDSLIKAKILDTTDFKTKCPTAGPSI